MSIGTKFSSLFSTSVSQDKAEENFDFFEFRCVLNDISVPENQGLSELIRNEIIDNDTFIISLSLDNDEPITLTSTANSTQSFSTALQRKIQVAGSEPFNFSIRINKTPGDKTNIYSLETFSNYLSNLPLKGLSHIFCKAFKKKDFLRFRSKEIQYSFSSKTVIFEAAEPEEHEFQEFNRSKYSEKIRSISHSDISPGFLLLPDDFDFDFTNIPNDQLALVLKRILFIVLIQSVFDITSFESNDELYFKLNGYKSLSGTLHKDKLDLDSIPAYLEIYNWLVASGNIIDKAGISRNIISLHVDKENGLSISKNTFLSIKSSFKIYEKENIKQYIEIRNKISDQIIDYYKRASQITNNFAAGFQKSLIAVLTFFSSVIAIRVIGNRSKTSLDDLISFDTYILTLLFIASSVIYLIYSRKEIKSQRKRFVDGYQHLKERYEDLLLSEDIKRIVNDDKEFTSDLQFIDDKTRWYTRLWGWTLSLIFIVSTYLCFKVDIHSFFSQIILPYFIESS